MAKKSSKPTKPTKPSFSLRNYRHKTGALCHPNEPECGTRDQLDHQPKHIREQIFDDQVITKSQLKAEHRQALKGLLTSDEPTAGAKRQPDLTTPGSFNGYRIQRSHFTISTLGFVLMLGVLLSLSMARSGLADYQVSDPEQDLAGLEIIVPDTGSNSSDNSDPDPDDQLDVPDTGDNEAEQGSQKLIAITFDDGPSSLTTPRLLDILTRENVPATFFVLGSLAARNPQIVSRAAAEGHAVGSHSWGHANLSQMSSTSIIADLTRANNAILAATGSAPTLFRPPYGAISKTLQNSAGLPLVLWSVDTRDWQSKNVESIYNIAIQNVKPGSIILFHDIYPTTVVAVERLIPALKQAGYTFATIPELFDQPLESGRIYRGSF